jgi:cell pole-organizing protein PopZ
MSSSPTPQHEPTMEEILASIRKIISEDQPEAAKPAPQPSPVRSPAPEAAQPEADVLELTEEVREEETVAPPAQPEPPIENDIAFENIEAEPEAGSDMDDLIPDSARSAMGRAFASLNAPAVSAPAGGTLDALFLRAIQDAFTPTLLEWVDSHQSEILEQLKPIIREWMDENLPSLIEAAVTRELARAAAANRPRRR